MTKWQEILKELSWSMPPADIRQLDGSALTVADGVAIVTAANETAGRWLAGSFTHVLKMRIRAHGLPCERVTIKY